MTWNNNNEGPWGSSSNKKPTDPKEWGKKNMDQGPSTPSPSSPEFEKFMKSLLDLFHKGMGYFKGPSSLITTALLVLSAIWLLSGLYQVGTDQMGVVMRFGAYDRSEGPGLRYHLPYPMEDVLLPNVTSQNEIQVGFRRMGRDRDDLRTVPEESMMLTQDQNIINVEFAVFWRVSDVQKYLFEIRDPETTIKMAAESIMREVIGQNKLQFELTDGRSQVAEDARMRLQKLMDEYNVGVIISQINLQTVSVPEEVKAAFQDVVNARSDQERFQNEAETHANKVVPEAKGEASKILQQAMAYRDQKIAIAQGDADRFKEVLAAYTLAKDITMKRLYLETMEDILSNSHKVIIEKSASPVLPYLPLTDAIRPKVTEGDPR